MFSLETRDRVRKLRAAGFTLRQVAEKTGVSISSAANIVKAPAKPERRPALVKALATAQAILCPRCRAPVVELVPSKGQSVCWACATWDQIKWSGNVRPVAPEVETQIVDEFVGSLRVSIPQGKGLRIKRRDVTDLTDRALWPASLLAQGFPIGKVAEQTFAHRQEIVRLVNWLQEIHGLSAKDLRRISRSVEHIGAIPEAIREHVAVLA